jgi:hypothetical protein
MEINNCPRNYPAFSPKEPALAQYFFSSLAGPVGRQMRNMSSGTKTTVPRKMARVKTEVSPSNFIFAAKTSFSAIQFRPPPKNEI